MRSGIGKKSIPFLGWGTGFLDYDNDGWLDLMFVNGHIYPAADRAGLGNLVCAAAAAVPQHARRQIRRGAGGERLGAGADHLRARSGLWRLVQRRQNRRGHQSDRGPPVLLRNVYPDHHHWVELKLVGGAEEPARRGGRDCLSDRQRNAAAPGCAERRQLCVDQRSAAALRPGRRDGRGNGGDSLAFGRKRDCQTARR